MSTCELFFNGVNTKKLSLKIEKSLLNRKKDVIGTNPGPGGI